MNATEQFVRNYICAAKKVEQRYGVPYLVCLGQGSVESDNGKAAPGNNFFGIKAFSNWKGKTQVFETKDFINNQWVIHKQTFRAYDSPEQGFMDYGNYLKNSGLYNAAFQTNNPYEFIQKIGPIYATSFYANTISGRMKTIQKLITDNNITCSSVGSTLLLITAATALSVAVVYKGDFKKVKKDITDLL